MSSSDKERDRELPADIRLKPEQIGWAAGLFDGEGSVCIDRGGVGKVIVSVTNSYRPALKLFKDWFDGYITTDSRKPVFRWWQYSKGAALFLLKIRPYLQIKKKQAEAAIDYHMLSRDGRRRGGLPTRELRQRARLAERIRALNGAQRRKTKSNATLRAPPSSKIAPQEFL